MGRSQSEKTATHARIVAIASRRLRERGLEGIGVADIMKEAGLTVGGFYKHFASRDALVAEAVEAAQGTWRRQADAAAARGEALRLSDLVEPYLSLAHRDAPGTGCVFGALAGDLGRQGGKARMIAGGRLAQAIEFLAGMMPEADAPSARKKAILAYSAMVGAIGLARVAVDDEDLSQEILATVRDALTAS